MPSLPQFDGRLRDRSLRWMLPHGFSLPKGLLEDVRGVDQELGRYDHHERREPYLERLYRDAVAYAHAGPGPEDGADDERWERRELLETGGDVADGGHHARAQNDDQARSDGALGTHVEAEDHQGDHHDAPADADETGEGADSDPAEEDDGGGDPPRRGVPVFLFAESLRKEGV